MLVGTGIGAGSPPEIADLAQTLRSNEPQAGAWRSAAAGLLARCDEGPARAALQEALWDDRPAGVRRAVAEAIAEGDASIAGSGLERSLGTALAAALSGEGPPEDALTIVRALGRGTSKEALRVLVETASDAERAPDGVRTAAREALGRLTGRRELASSAEACAEWWRRAQWLTEEDWAREVAPTPALVVAAASPGERLAGVYRRLHSATAEAGRDAVLVEMLESPEEPVRLAGFELIMLSLVNAKSVGDGPASAAARCIDDASSAIRAEAARTIEVLGRADDWAALLRRLENEQDETAASAMLRAASHRPSAELIAPAMRWLERSGEARAAAAEAMDASRRAGHLTAATGLDQVRAAVAAAPSETWDAATLRLAAGVGLMDEVSRLAGGADRSRARQAAAALAESADGLAALLPVAAKWDDLFAEASAGLLKFRATVDGYRAMSALPARAADERAGALDRLLRAMAPAELNRLVNSGWQPLRTEELLGPIVTPEFLAGTGDLPERVELALELSRARLELNRPAEALAALALLPSGWQGPRAVAARITALVCLGRYADADAAASVTDPPEGAALPAEMLAEAWLQAAERCAKGRPGGALTDEFESRFAGRLTVEQAGRWRILSSE